VNSVQQAHSCSFISLRNPWEQPLFIEITNFSLQEHEKKARMMFVVDIINRLYGRDTLFFAIQGITRPWRMQQHKLSHRFTTQRSQIYAVR
jgi:hypothetical protein